MTKLLHVISSCELKHGGPIESARNLGIVWSKQGHTHDLLSLDPAGEMMLPGYPGQIFTVGVPEGPMPWQKYRYTSNLVPWLHRYAPLYDAVIVSGLWRYQAMGVANALAGGDIPYFVFTHGMLDPWFKQRYPLKNIGKQVSWWFAEGRLLNNASNVMFTCEEEGVLAHNAFWPYRVKPACVGYGTSDVSADAEGQIAAFRAAMPQLGGRKFLLFLSRVHEKKGCDILVDAFASISERAPDLDLVIAGPDQTGLVAQLRAQAAKLGLADRVHFPGMLLGDVKYGAFRAAEAFVLTSHQENFGIVVAEAMACRTPVLISNKVNIWREIEADGAGLVANDDRPSSCKMLSDFLDMTPEQHDAMRQRARDSFVERFQIEGVADRLMALIEQRIAEEKAAKAR